MRWRFLCFPVSAGLISARVNAVEEVEVSLRANVGPRLTNHTAVS